MTEGSRVSIVIPAYEEGTAIVPVLDRIEEGVTLPHEVLVVVDDAGDSTVAAIEGIASVRVARERLRLRSGQRDPLRNRSAPPLRLRL